MFRGLLMGQGCFGCAALDGLWIEQNVVKIK